MWGLYVPRPGGHCCCPPSPLAAKRGAGVRALIAMPGGSWAWTLSPPLPTCSQMAAVVQERGQGACSLPDQCHNRRKQVGCDYRVLQGSIACRSSDEPVPSGSRRGCQHAPNGRVVCVCGVGGTLSIASVCWCVAVALLCVYVLYMTTAGCGWMHSSCCCQQCALQAGTRTAACGCSLSAALPAPGALWCGLSFQCSRPLAARAQGAA